MKLEFSNILMHCYKSKNEDEFRQNIQHLISQPINLFFVDNLSGIQDIYIKNKIDIVLLNIEDTDDEEEKVFIRLLYSLPQDFPIIVISDNEEATLEFIRAGADEVINKSTINTAQFIKTINCSIERKRKYNEKLLQKDNLFKTIVESTTEAVFIKDIQGKYILINDAVAKFTNKHKEDILGNDDTFIFSAEDAKQIMENDKTVMNSGTTTAYSTNITIAGGFNKVFDATKGPVKDENGKIIGIFGISRDVTSKIESEKKLIESELKLKQSVSILHSTLESIAEGILVVNNEGQVINYNQSFKNLWQIPNDVIQSTDDKILLNYVLNQLEAPDLFLNKVQELYAHTDEISFDTIKFKDGRIFERYSQPQKVDGISIGRVWSFRNITDKFLVDEELKLKDSAIENAISGIGMADLEGNLIYGNSTLLRMWGLNNKEELIGKKLTEVFEGERIYQTINNLQINGFDKGEDIAKRNDGTLFDVEFAANVVVDNEGTPKCMFGSFIDITERKRLEQFLKESETLFRELAENAHGGIVLLDENSKYKYVSSSTKRIMGYNPEYYIGKDPIEHTHPDDLPILIPKLNEILSTPDKVITAQYRYKHADGSWRWLESTFSNLLHIQNVNSLLINFQDITDRKKAERELLESNEKERQLIEHLQNIREEERAKISREFHDEIGQHLTVLKMDVAWLNKKARFKEDTAVAQRLEELQSLLDETVKSFRRILSDLRPTLIDDVGLEAAMEWHIQEFGRKNNIKTEFKVQLPETDYPEIISLPLFRILQESLNNISKHAHANNVIVSLIQEGKNIELSIVDDGVGFDYKKNKDTRSFGIMGMKERVTITGGTFEVNSFENKGTTIKVTIPLK